MKNAISKNEMETQKAIELLKSKSKNDQRNIDK